MPQLGSKETLPQGMGCWGCQSSDAPEMPPVAGGLMKRHEHQGEFGPAVQRLPPERSRQPAIRKRSRRHPPPPALQECTNWTDEGQTYHL